MADEERRRRRRERLMQGGSGRLERIVKMVGSSHGEEESGGGGGGGVESHVEQVTRHQEKEEEIRESVATKEKESSTIPRVTNDTIQLPSTDTQESAVSLQFDYTLLVFMLLPLLGVYFESLLGIFLVTEISLVFLRRGGSYKSIIGDFSVMFMSAMVYAEIKKEIL